MATYTGKDGAVKSGANTLAVLRGFNVDEAANELDASIIDGTNWKKNKGGQESWSGTIEAFYDPADPVTSLLVNGAQVDLELFPTGDVTGAQELAGNALITGVSLPIEVDGMIQQSFTLAGNGELVHTTIV